LEIYGPRQGRMARWYFGDENSRTITITEGKKRRRYGMKVYVLQSKRVMRTKILFRYRLLLIVFRCKVFITTLRYAHTYIIWRQSILIERCLGGIRRLWKLKRKTIFLTNWIYHPCSAPRSSNVLNLCESENADTPFVILSTPRFAYF